MYNVHYCNVFSPIASCVDDCFLEKEKQKLTCKKSTPISGFCNKGFRQSLLTIAFFWWEWGGGGEGGGGTEREGSTPTLVAQDKLRSGVMG